MGNVVEARGLTKNFGSLRAVDKVSLNIAEGELFGLLGPNGSGKTTMIKMLTGQLKPTKGTAKVLGINAVKEPVRVRETVGIIPEQETPPSFLTAEEYLHFAGNIRKMEKELIKEKCDYWFDLLEFEDQKDVLCKDLSRGTRQKLMFAQAFMHEPRLAFIDEPVINLDPIIQKKVKDYLLDFIRDNGTVFFSTHVLEIAEEICTSIGIIDKGRIIHKGPIAAIKKKGHLDNFFLKLVGD